MSNTIRIGDGAKRSEQIKRGIRKGGARQTRRSGGCKTCGRNK